MAMPIPSPHDSWERLNTQLTIGSVALNLAICLAGTTLMILLVRQTALLGAPRKTQSYALAGIAFGFGAWATHFVAMLRYGEGFAAGYAVIPTVVSFIVALMGGMASVLVLMRKPFPSRSRRAAASALLAASLAAMQFTAMISLVVPVLLQWTLFGFVLSIVLPMGFFYFGLSVALAFKGRASGIIAIQSLTAGVGAMHFTAMGTISLVPGKMPDHRLALSLDGMITWIALASLAIFGLSICVQLVRQQAAHTLAQKERAYTIIVQKARDTIAQTNARLDTALENMHEGLCMFDSKERIVLCNRRFGEIWRLDDAAGAPGTTLNQLILNGFTNSEGHAAAAQRIGAFRAILQDALGEKRISPVIIDLGEHGTFSVANNPLPDGGWVTTCVDITQQRRTAEQIEHMAVHDALTGLPNRIQFYLHLDHALEHTDAKRSRIAVIAIDLDRFKEINDVYGHATGDWLLQTIAQRLDEARRDGEVIARLGGDEFAAAKRFRDQGELDAFLARLFQGITTPVVDGERRLVASVSLGVAIQGQDGDNRETLLNNADLAMSRAKASLRERIFYFEPGMDESARLRRQIANDLRLATERGEFTLFYQPQRLVQSGALSGYEALLRWNHPTRGFVPPDVFIPVAEETGEILQIGEWVLRQACLEARGWSPEIKVAVNVSPVQFLQSGLVDTVRQILLDTGLSPRRLELEITETAIITDKQRALDCLRQIKAMGVSVAIDDFGTGYSSLDTLHSFPFDKIKIDKSFLLKADTNTQARAIIRAVLALGRSLNIPVLAEGVENAAQLEVLKAEGCEEAQGYFFGRPAPAPSLQNQAAAKS
ncbi:diguanylate cyclase/phosphodiesterase [Novosphingobium sp. Rr 2-17]|uniref:bifunctional diguanylate cyclase/phosphodiesterase n=1 Tax=Novosphingobium sp. Rr 2-17 TaxID=555793 RepID=UPI0002699E52|nr:EAL domain-containing protein [Novosphingobium sp. Rr 2-17]EIZ80805.1 diguanylate cyclase/phosphodiesterase [Novosphingobium sp. Rr 2-17]